ncbi:MAG: hypothetical protein ABJF01_08685 [bacterium]
MTQPFMSVAMLALLAGGVGPAPMRAQSVTVPLTAGRWRASDSIRFENYLGRPSLYINKGVALASDIDVRNGTIEFDMAATKQTNFLGVAFHAKALDFSEDVIFRVGLSGTSEAMQYAPAFNDYGIAWQIYHGDGSNAVATLTREQWMHVKVVLSGARALVFLNDSVKPTLVVPRLAGAGGGAIGVWGGNFGRGAYYSNIRYTIDPSSAAPASSAPVSAVTTPRGTITDWDLSEIFNAPALVPGRRPDLAAVTWQRVRTEPAGFVLINRYRHAPAVDPPADPVTHEILADSVMGGRVAGTKVVFARASIESDRDRIARLRFGYSDGLVIYANGEPLYFGASPFGFRPVGNMETDGEAVFLHLKKGHNSIVFAVTEYFGGWGFWARLDP